MLKALLLTCRGWWHWDLPFPDTGPKGMVRGFIPACHSCISKPIIPCLAPLPAKAPSVPLTPCGPSSGSPPPLCYIPSLPAIFPRPPSKICARSSIPIHTSNPSHSYAQAKFHVSITTNPQLPSPIPVQCNCSSTPSASHPAPQLNHNLCTASFFRATCPLYFSMH